MADSSALSPIELEVLWADFHSTVNMTAQEPAAWLRTRAAGAVGTSPPENAGGAAGRHVLAVLRRRRTELTADDVRLMREVVDRVAVLTEGSREPEPRATVTRHRLMSLGHDQLRP
ncbi:DUF3140 domain-containing protein [Streptomyces sp. Q6]|uniref:DUF3140 domain-containing protein n=1 Tax=Streptomyces citrinus TaxID=3118173 RepID=A0ACD5A5T4_9ACTN